MKDIFYGRANLSANKLKTMLDHKDWVSWLMGTHNKLFDIASNFMAHYQKACEEKQLRAAK